MVKKGSPNVIIIDGASLDKMQNDLEFTIDLKKLTTFLEKNLKDYELYYFNISLTGKSFQLVVQNLGYEINLEAKTQADVGYEIANHLTKLGKYSSNISIVGGLLPQYAEAAQKKAKDISKTINTVTIYSFVDLIIQKAFIGNSLQFCDLGNYEAELGIVRKTKRKKIPELAIDSVKIMKSTKNLTPTPANVIEKKNIIFVDGHTLDQATKDMEETIDFKKLKNLITKDLDSYDLRYFNLNSTDKIFIEQLTKLGYTVDVSSIKKSNLSCLIMSTLAKTVSKFDSITIIGEADNNYLPPLIDKNTSLAKKATKLFAEHNFTCNNQSKNSIVFHKLKDLVNEIKVTQDAVIFIDGENFNNMIEIMGIREVDWENLLKLLLNSRNLVNIYYYMKMPMTEKKVKLKKNLESLGYKVVAGPANGHDTDPRMISDIQMISQTDVANNYIVVAGDHSYLDPLAIPCVNNDWRCEIFSLDEMISDKYKDVPGFVIIEPERFKEIISTNRTTPAVETQEKSTEKEENMDKTELPIAEPISDAQNLLNIVNQMIVNGTLSNANFTIIVDNREINIIIGTKEKPTQT